MPIRWLQIASDCGLDREEVERFLPVTGRDQEVKVEEAAGHRFGIRGVPYFIVNGSLSISGAQPPDIFVSALQQVGNSHGKKGRGMMAVQVYGCNHIVIEVTDAKKAVKFYADVFGLKMLRGGEGAAWCKLGEHQFMAIFEVDETSTGSHEAFRSHGP